MAIETCGRVVLVPLPGRRVAGPVGALPARSARCARLCGRWGRTAEGGAAALLGTNGRGRLPSRLGVGLAAPGNAMGALRECWVDEGASAGRDAGQGADLGIPERAAQAFADVADLVHEAFDVGGFGDAHVAELAEHGGAARLRAHGG